MVSTRILLLFVSSFIYLASFAQEHNPPSDGNAVVYIVRTTSFGSALTFNVFHNDKFVGVFKGKGYLRYELPAGKHVIWADSENKKFLDCELKSGGIYIISSMHSPGVIKNHVQLSAVTSIDANFKKCKNTILKGKPITTSDKKKASIDKTLSESGYSENVLKQFQEGKFKNQTIVISPEMAIPNVQLY